MTTSPPRHIIGLVGYARTGKDEAARVLREVGYERVAFADALRDMLVRLDPFIPPGLHREGFWPGGQYRVMIGTLGYDTAKTHPHVRGLLQRLGTEAVRQVLGPDTWVDAWEARVRGVPKVVATDVRFPNEVDRIRRLGGRILLVRRPGVGPLNDHASERLPGIVEPDATVVNDGTLEELEHRVRHVTYLLEHSTRHEPGRAGGDATA